VVVDIDLRTEALGSDPFTPDDKTFNAAERDIRSAVLAMTKTPFLVAQPLIRTPRDDQKQNYDYVAIGTILHNLEKPNLRFGQVEQDLRDDSVLRRFPATLQILNPDPILNPNADDTAQVTHIAVRVCELVTDNNLCGRDREKDARAGAAGAMPVSPMRFGARPVLPKESVQFRYVLARDVNRLVNFGVKVIEARAVLAKNFDARSALKGRIVIIGSTARGRGDYHFTPLDVLGGETAGVIIVANEVVAALGNYWLESPPWHIVASEKLMLIIVSTFLIFWLFWYPRIRCQPRTYKSLTRTLLSLGLVVVHFVVVVAGAILFNVICVWLISLAAYRQGELTDPVTPVIAAVLDIVVGLCTIVGYKASSWAEYWADRWQSRFAKKES
jgi:hypothetical protein